MNDQWTTSVKELLNVFRDSLIALIPLMDKAHISWKDAEAYDEWENICESLYKNIVESSILSGALREDSLADYGFDYSQDSGKGYIKVLSSTYNQENLYFSCFLSQETPLDSVKVCVLNELGEVTGTRILEYKELNFTYVSHSLQKDFQELNVPL